MLVGVHSEAFLDELARAAGIEPWRYRQRLLTRQPRLRQVLERLVERAGLKFEVES
jgi:CO/xanthine dehydrogenase Mo-binding subunit